MRTRHHRTLRRILALLLVTAATLTTLGFAGPATALPGLDVVNCGDTDAPIPASPYGDGSFIARPSTAETKLPEDYKPGRIIEETDPFRHPDDVSLESVYGTAPSWWVYDTGCMGRFVAGAGTALGNIELQISGIMPSWSHALLDTVIGDSELFAVLDAPVAAATRAVSEGVWGPWLPISLLAVAALVLWRARSGHLGGAVTAATTALVVLGLSSILMQYPTESVRWVDAGARNVTGLIAAGFSDGKVIPKNSSSESAATGAIDAQMDDLIRQTQYRTWLDGVFGDPDSAIARKYGPRVFRATHFSWAEHATYRSDPNGEGKKILEAKQEAFKKYAEEIKQADPIAYDTFTGKDWTSRATSGLVNLFVVGVPCVFLLLAGLFAVMGFVLIRLVVPLAPAAGVIFMYDKTRDLAVGWLKRVVGPLIMGPVCFVIALVLLRFTSAIFEVENMWFVLKLGLIVVLTGIAFRLSGVLGMVPGYERARRSVMAAFGQAVGAAAGAAVGAREGLRSEAGPGATTRPPADLAAAPGGVWHPAFEARAPSPPRELGPPDGFVPYMPPPRAVTADPSAGAVPAAAASLGDVAARRSMPTSPGIGDRGLREEFEQLPEEKKRKWVPLPGYPSGGTALEKARFYTEKLNDGALDLPEWQRNVIAGRRFNFAVADQSRATEVAINKYVGHTDSVSGEKVTAKKTNYFLDGLGFDGEVVSNKFCQIADLKPETWASYVNEFRTKYDTGMQELRIADTAGARAAVARGELYEYEINKPLNGIKVLRVPRQEKGIPAWATNYAVKYDVTIQEVDTHPDAGVIQ